MTESLYKAVQVPAICTVNNEFDVTENVNSCCGDLHYRTLATVMGNHFFFFAANTIGCTYLDEYVFMLIKFPVLHECCDIRTSAVSAVCT